jgi:tetratricopeptide (TPR) repeat protein
MKHFITVIFIVSIFQAGYAQKQPAQDFYFNSARFEEAKINNEEAWVFFMHYPYNSNINGSDGNVFVSFIVRKNGQLDSIQILNNPGELFKETALDALLKSSGHWNPCNFDGILFDKKYIACFNFTNTGSFFYKKDKSLRYLRTGRTDKALKFINQAITINPFDIELYQFRARIYRRLDKKDLEVSDIETIRRLNINLLFNIWF